jgi:RNA polymerase subunit RPABC4/transcription elongation factor Spt4
MIEIAGRAAQVLVALAGAYLVVLWFALIVWTFRDIEGRSRSVFTQVFSTLLSVLFFVPGVLLYLLLRPKETLDEAFQRSLEEEYLLQDLEELPHCPACHRYVEDDFVLCPHCHAQLREACTNCERLVDLRWPLCPYCGVVQSEHAESADQVEPPAARWTAPGLRRRRAVEGATRPQPLAPGSAEEGREVAAAIALAEVSRAEPPLPDDTSTLAASLASGVRSMVRPFDRLLGRGGNDDLPAVSPRAPSQSEDGRTRRDRRDENDYMMYGPTLAQPTVGSLEDVHSEPLVAARNRFASNGQPGRAGDDAPRYGSGYGANQPDPIVPFPTEAERTGRTPEPAALSWPPVDKEKPK